jgi:hypothetical protein
MRFYWLCAQDAWRGSLNLANAWSGLWGPVLVYLVTLWWRGKPLTLPDQLDEYMLLLVLSFLGATWIALLIGRFVTAPARLYARLEASIPAPIESDLEASLGDKVYEMDPDPSLMYVAFCVKVRNRGNSFLRNCQVTFGSGERVRYPVSPPFALRRGESVERVFVRTKHNDPDPSAYVTACEVDSAGRWKDAASWRWVPQPGLYEIIVFSADTSPCVFNVELAVNKGQLVVIA